MVVLFHHKPILWFCTQLMILLYKASPVSRVRGKLLSGPLWSFVDRNYLPSINISSSKLHCSLEVMLWFWGTHTQGLRVTVLPWYYLDARGSSSIPVSSAPRPPSMAAFVTLHCNCCHPVAVVCLACYVQGPVQTWQSADVRKRLVNGWVTASPSHVDTGAKSLFWPGVTHRGRDCLSIMWGFLRPAVQHRPIPVLADWPWGCGISEDSACECFSSVVLGQVGLVSFLQD